MKFIITLFALVFGLLSCKEDSCPNCIVDLQNGSNDLVEVRIDGVIKYTMAPGEIITEVLTGSVQHRIEGYFQTAFPHDDFDVLVSCNGGCKVGTITLSY